MILISRWARQQRRRSRRGCVQGYVIAFGDAGWLVEEIAEVVEEIAEVDFVVRRLEV